MSDPFKNSESTKNPVELSGFERRTESSAGSSLSLGRWLARASRTKLRAYICARKLMLDAISQLGGTGQHRLSADIMRSFAIPSPSKFFHFSPQRTFLGVSTVKQVRAYLCKLPWIPMIPYTGSQDLATQDQSLRMTGISPNDKTLFQTDFGRFW